MNLQRMIVVPPHTFEIWKNILIHDTRMTDLDKKVKSILNNKKLNDISKWQLYKQTLLQFRNSKEDKNGITTHKPPLINDRKRLINVSTETPRILKREKFIETDSLAMKDEETSTIDIDDSFVHMKKRTSQIAPNKTIEEIFETSNKFASLDEDNFGNSDGEQNYTFDQDDTIKKRALEGQPQHVKIVRERPSLKPNEYRAFELSSGDNVSVPVEKHIRVTRSRSRAYGVPREKSNEPGKQSRKIMSSSSTPSKKEKQSGKGAFKNLPWIVFK